ncbi:MAG: hypothetical protein ACLR8Y_08240 [Alistipes indistinctus]
MVQKAWRGTLFSPALVWPEGKDREIKCICNTYTTEMRWKGYKKNGPGMVPDARKPVPVRESGDVGRVDFFLTKNDVGTGGIRSVDKYAVRRRPEEMRPVVGAVWCGVVCIRGIECIIENKFLIFVTCLGNTIYG